MLRASLHRVAVVCGIWILHLFIYQQDSIWVDPNPYPVPFTYEFFGTKDAVDTIRQIIADMEEMYEGIANI